MLLAVFFFNDTATTEIYTLSLHDALPIFGDLGGGLGDHGAAVGVGDEDDGAADGPHHARDVRGVARGSAERVGRSEEHTSELQSRQYLVCRLLLEKKKKSNGLRFDLTASA